MADDHGREGLEAWLTDSYPVAYRTAWLILRNAADAEDAVQEAYLRVWRFRDAVPGGDGRRAWLYRVVTNACMSQLRAAQARPPAAGGDADVELVATEDAPAVQAEAAVLADAVAAALAGLPELLRLPVVLRYWTGLSEREIATVIRRRPGTVKSRLYDARQRLSADPALAGWIETTLERAR